METAFPHIESQRVSALNLDDLRTEVAKSSTTKAFPLSDGALRYVAAVYDPRDVNEEPFIPTQVQLSAKRHYFARGSFSTGATGVGFIIANLSWTNDTPQVLVTTAASVGGVATALSAFTGTSSVANNSEFVAASFGSGAALLQGRTVGCAIYVKYADTELKRGGDMILFEEPNHNDISAYTYNSILGFPTARRVTISNKWQHVCYSPNSMAETNFVPNRGGLWNGSSLPWMLAVPITSAGAPCSFDFAVDSWVEIAGATVRGQTMSYNDPVGYGVVQSGMNMAGQLDSYIGIHGFVSQIHASMANTSGVTISGAARGNWVGLLSYLPQIAALAMPLIKAGVKAFAKKNPNSSTAKVLADQKAAKQAKAEKKKKTG